MNERQMALEALRYDLRERLRHYRPERSGTPGGPQPATEDDMTRHLARTRQELERVERTLLRIASGEGEYCARCMMTLDGWQLTADPCTTLCAHCQAQPWHHDSPR
ncbi:RNA polymerase-binding transcription factor DksA [Kushneria sinocarnis]|uniref:RNA polymerase-binding transcription factor DksA n=1 Tax=Kushneria sinocarnis TaxID=595502 RepID=A0A420WWN1_9GAMM|nr:hypothetical protein [Kushneria sinocarnis]RKR03525.1 RNA polymerase-binding transcription factor DksA [Kushneria sinocarnis]